MNGHTSADDDDDDDDDELEPTPPIYPTDNPEQGTLSERESPVQCPPDWGDDPAALEMIMIKNVKVGSEVSFLLFLFR